MASGWQTIRIPWQASAFPSPELIAVFSDIVGEFSVLGLFYAGDMVPGEILIARTEGRANITEKVSALPDCDRLASGQNQQSCADNGMHTCM